MHKNSKYFVFNFITKNYININKILMLFLVVKLSNYNRSMKKRKNREYK